MRHTREEVLEGGNGNKQNSDGLLVKARTGRQRLSCDLENIVVVARRDSSRARYGPMALLSTKSSASTTYLPGEPA